MHPCQRLVKPACAYPCGHMRVLAVRSAPCQPEIRQLCLHVGGEEDVGRLEVTVDDLRGRGAARDEEQERVVSRKEKKKAEDEGESMLSNMYMRCE